jgi:hypothetical protein
LFKKFLALFSTSLLAAALVVGAATPALAYDAGNPPPHPEANQASNWEWETGETCVKDDTPRTTASYTVVAPAADRVYSKIILKSSTDNAVFNDPATGDVITTFNTKNISHIIFCTVPKPVLNDAAASINVTPATCEAAAQLVLGTVTNATWGPVTGAYSVTATATSGHKFAAIPANPDITVSGDGKTKTFTGTLAAQLSGGSCVTIPECLPKSAVSYTYSKLTNSGTITVVNPDPTKYSNDLCDGFWVTATSWKYLAGDSIWPQKLDFVQKLAKITSVGVYPYAAPVLCGQGDIYASFIAQPDPSQYLLGPNQPGTGPTTAGGSFVETFLHNMGFLTSTPGDTWTNDGVGCNEVPVVEPTVTKIETCGVYGSITATDTALIDYTITPNNNQSLVNMQGSYTVTAVAISPAVLDETYPVGGWTFELKDYEDCYKPAVTVEVGGCYAADGSSFKTLSFLFDNTGSTVDVTFTVPGATDVLSPLDPKPSISVLVPAGGTATVVANPVSKLGANYDVFANGVLLKNIAVDSFVGCLDSKPGDPKATPAGCVAGDQTPGNIWVDLIPGLVYTITGTNTGNTTLITPVTTADNAVPAGTYEVTVVAEPGHILGGDTVWPYEITVDPPVNCVKPFAKASLATVPATCVFDGSINNTLVVLEHATWNAALPTAPGNYTVTATAEAGYTFDGTATTKSIPVTIEAAADAEDCQPTLGLVLPKLTSTPFSCTANGSYTLGVETGFDASHIKWTVNGVSDVASGTYAVTSSQVVTIVAVAVAPNGLEPSWVQPAPLTFTKPSAVDCGELPTLAFTGGAISLGVQTLVGGILFVLIGGALILRRKLQERSAE